MGRSEKEQTVQRSGGGATAWGVGWGKGCVAVSERGLGVEDTDRQGKDGGRETKDTPEVVCVLGVGGQVRARGW